MGGDKKTYNPDVVKISDIKKEFSPKEMRWQIVEMIKKKVFSTISTGEILTKLKEETAGNEFAWGNILAVLGVNDGHFFDPENDFVEKDNDDFKYEIQTVIMNIELLLNVKMDKEIKTMLEKIKIDEEI